MPFSFRSSNNRERGVALILVTLLVALASILVINLTFSTTLASRQSANMQRATQAEYLLKSAVNVSRVLLFHDKTPEDSAKDMWGQFINGIKVPSELLDIQDKNVSLELEIRPEDSKFPLSAIIPSGAASPDPRWKDALVQLFRSAPLSFDDDKEVDQTGYYPNKHFSAEQLAGVLIDYIDPDHDSYIPGGIEADGTMPEGFWANQPIKRISELASLPGFSPARLQKLIPLLSAVGGIGGATMRVNINLAPAVVLRSLSPRLDSGMVDAMISFRNSDQGPFTQQNYVNKLVEITGDADLVRNIQSMIAVESKWFQVIAKVNYGTSLYFVRAYVTKGRNGEYPEIQSMELF